MRDVAAAQPTADLLERAQEVAALEESLHDVESSDRGRVVLVGAEAGGGKTALVRRFCAGQGARVLWGACDPLFTPRPLGPLLAVADALGGEVADAIRNGEESHQVVAALVGELSSSTSSVLVVDDLHWADEATLDVFRLLARRVETVPGLVIGTYRDAELDRHHPLRRVLGELATSDSVRRLRLDRLSPAAVAALAEPHGVDAVELHRKTGGNPFFVVEVLAAGTEEIPDTVRDAVLARAAPLSAGARALLESVAIVPQQTELWLLESIAGEAFDSVDECVSSGMLLAEGARVAFRHELARLAVEESTPVKRKVELHRAAVRALSNPPSGEPDLARLAHHAEGAGDTEAVRRFAPAAGDRAASLGSHREAAAQYARALRFGGELEPAERAELLERQVAACFVTDQYDEGIAAIKEAIDCRLRLGDRLRQGDDTRVLSEFLWCPGRVQESMQSGREAVRILEALPPSRELALAYANLASIAHSDSRADEAVRGSEQALALAVRLEDLETAVYASVTIGACQGDFDRLVDTLERARRAGLHEKVGRTYAMLGGAAVGWRRYELAERYLADGIAYCGERGIELFRLYLLASRARLELDLGRWSEAAATASLVRSIPRTSTSPRIHALVVLALVRARRGDPDVKPLLDEAWELAEPTGELFRLGPVAAAKAEAAWLTGDQRSVDDATRGALALAVERRSSGLIGELACWRRRAGLVDEIPAAAPPFSFELAGEPARAAAAWREFGCHYDAAVARSFVDDEDAQREAYDELKALGAQPAAAIVARKLRDRGATGLPRGPRPATRRNAAQLTEREVEVLSLVAGGLRNSEIAARLYLSVRTVDHHVSAILRKLGVRSRGEASTAALTQGLVSPGRE